MTALPRQRVLVVDDDSALRTALKFSLELEGFEVDTFPSGEALLLGELPTRGACLVLDLNLPGVSGLEALATLRDRNVRLPALLITSQPKREVRTRAAQAGVTIVEKPLLGDHLVQSIRKALAA